MEAAEREKDEILRIVAKDESKLEKEFEWGYGEGFIPTPFTGIGVRYLYIPVDYDGLVTIVKAPIDRNEPMEMQ